MFLKDNRAALDKNLSTYLKNAGYKKLTHLQEKIIPITLQGRDVLVEAGEGEGKTGAFLLPMLMQIHRDNRGIKALILTNSADEAKKVAHQFKRFSGHSHRRPVLAVLGAEHNVRKELRLLSSKPDIIAATTERIIDHLRRNNLSLQTVQISVLDIPAESETSGFYKDLLYIYSKLPSKLQTVGFVPEILKSETMDTILKRPLTLSRGDWHTAEPEETTPAATTEEKNPDMNNENETKDGYAKLKSELKRILETVKGEENPEILNEYRRIFRRNVPLHLRAYVCAYLLKERSAMQDDQKAAMSTLFVGVGKARRIFPRDLARLFSSALKISPSSIGSIKILDNYSFVEIPESEAERAITLLNNSDFRGRKLTVNHARKKET